MTQVPRQNTDRYDFLPNVMLPSWYVTDDRLIIRNYNPFALKLASSFSIDHLLAKSGLSLEIDNLPVGYESLWASILKPDESNLEYMSTALSVVHEHRGILESAVSGGEPLNPKALVEKLQKVKGSPGVKPYVRYPQTGAPYLEIGIKISPPQGLELMRKASFDEDELSFIDVVMAYKVELGWTDGQLSSICFVGTQPAIHDATERHELWARQKESQAAELSQFLAHALKAPLDFIQRDLTTLENTGLSMDSRSRTAKNIIAGIEDLRHLVELLSFISSYRQLDFTIRKTSLPNRGDVWFSISEVRDCFARVLRGIRHKRTNRAIEAEKIAQMLSNSHASESLNVEAQDGLEPYLIFAEKQMHFEGVAAKDFFVIDTSRQADEGRSLRDVREQIKTALINLVLTEMIVNAVKNASEDDPRVLVRIICASTIVKIEVSNNGRPMTLKEFNAPEEVLAKVPGEKRKALGLLLNKKAVEKIGGKLNWSGLGPLNGTSLALEIPCRISVEGSGSGIVAED